jgi:PAS domain S-box-containing protein
MPSDAADCAEALIAGTSDAIVFADADGTIARWNPGAARMSGYTAAEAIGSSLDIIIPDTLRARLWHGYRETMRTGRTRYAGGETLAVPAIRKDSSRLSLEFTIVAFTDPAGRMRGIGAILRDVTVRFAELRTLRKQLAERGR